jgi:hypothetical protein
MRKPKGRRRPGGERRLKSHTDRPVQDRSVHPDITSAAAVVYVDKFGRRLSAAVLTNWSPRALEALQVRPLDQAPEFGHGQR